MYIPRSSSSLLDTSLSIWERTESSLALTMLLASEPAPNDRLLVSLVLGWSCLSVLFLGFLFSAFDKFNVERLLPTLDTSADDAALTRMIGN